MAMVLTMSDRFGRLISLMALAVEVALRFLIPATLCVAYIVAMMFEYNRVHPNPRDHFTPARAITHIAIPSITLICLDGDSFSSCANQHLHNVAEE